jgi:guanosine-3',5'-bis(diphosphate) 3'-pyrophosphohydrolase
LIAVETNLSVAVFSCGNQEIQPHWPFPIETPVFITHCVNTLSGTSPEKPETKIAADRQQARRPKGPTPCRGPEMKLTARTGKGGTMPEMKLTETGIAIPALMDATMFAAEKHRGQKRKDVQGTPYINHPIMVVNLMANIGGITDIEALQAGMLHDTVEDTDATPEEIEERFGYRVRSLVMEVTDDKNLHKDVRKQLQIEHAPHLSPRAKIIKLADKTANLRDLVKSPPIGWGTGRQQRYIEWSHRVVAGCQGENAILERLYEDNAALANMTLR